MSDLFFPKRLMIVLSLLSLFPGVASLAAGQAPWDLARGGATTEGHHLETKVEGIFVHTDRDIYVAGESLLFKAYQLQNEQAGQAFSGIAYLALRGRHGTVAGMAVPVQGREADGLIYLEDTLSTGWYELVAFTNRMRAAGERHYFRKTLFIANRFDRDLAFPTIDGQGPEAPEIESPARQPWAGTPETAGSILQLQMPESSGTREAVRLQISMDEGAHAFAMLSVSVSPVEACNEEGMTLSDYADGSATRPCPDSGSSPLRSPDPSACAETNAWLLQGQVTDPETNEGVEGAWVALNTPGTQVTYLHALTGAGGRFAIALPFYYNARDLYLLAGHESGGSLNIALEDKFALESVFGPEKIPGMEARRDYLLRNQDLLTAVRAFQADYFRRTGRRVLTASPPSFLFAQPLLTVIPSQYTPFEDLQEIAREIILPWRIRRTGDVYRSQLHCADTGSQLPGTPMYFVDGILVQDLGRLIPLGSGQIDRIMVHNTQWVYDGLTVNGAVNIITKGEQYLDLIPVESYERTRFELSLPDRAFNPPAYPGGDSVNREEPDLRNTLYWNPDIRIARGRQAELRFYTGDIPGEYLIRVEGVTSGGEGVSLSQKFIVEL